jgi:hypothetical protein
MKALRFGGGGGGGGGGGDARQYTLLVSNTIASALLAATALLLLMRPRGAPPAPAQSVLAGAGGAPPAGAGLPAAFAGAPFKPHLGCWHMVARSQGGPPPPRPRAVVPIDGASSRGDGFGAAKRAIEASAAANPGLEFVIVTSEPSLPAVANLGAIPFDMWYCPQLLLGTLLAVGSEYPGPKLLAGPHTVLPKVPACRFSSTRGHPIVYVLSRGEAGKSCRDLEPDGDAAGGDGEADANEAAEEGTLDALEAANARPVSGIMYDRLPPSVTASLRRARGRGGAVGRAVGGRGAARGVGRCAAGWRAPRPPSAARCASDGPLPSRLGRAPLPAPPHPLPTPPSPPPRRRPTGLRGTMAAPGTSQ